MDNQQENNPIGLHVYVVCKVVRGLHPKPQTAPTAFRLTLTLCCCLHMTECTLNYQPFRASQGRGVFSQRHDGKRGREVGGEREKRVTGCR